MKDDTAKLIARDVLENRREHDVCNHGECFYPTVVTLAAALEAAEAQRATLAEAARRIRDEFPDESLRGRGDYYAENLHRARDIASAALDAVASPEERG